MQILLPEYNFQTVLVRHLLQNVESNKGMLLAALFKNCIDDIVKDLVSL
jgi:hypothetical protein